MMYKARLRLRALPLIPLIGLTGCAAIGGNAPHVGSQPATLPVRSIVSLPSRHLPSKLENTKVHIDGSSGLPFRIIAQRIADQTGTEVLIEERPARDGIQRNPPKTTTVTGLFAGKTRAVMDRIGAASGYDWVFDSKKHALMFYRYHDAEGIGRINPVSQVASASQWRIDLARHKTLKDVVMEWGKEAGWFVVWPSEVPHYAVTTEASFGGDFPQAAGQLLASTQKTEQPIAPVAYPKNRRMVIVNQED